MLTFISPANGPQSTLEKAHESPWQMSLPLLVLSFGAIFVGYLGRDMIIGAGSDFFKHAIFVLPEHLNVLEAEFISTTVK